MTAVTATAPKAPAAPTIIGNLLRERGKICIEVGVPAGATEQRPPRGEIRAAAGAGTARPGFARLYEIVHGPTTGCFAKVLRASARNRPGARGFGLLRQELGAPGSNEPPRTSSERESRRRAELEGHLRRRCPLQCPRPPHRLRHAGPEVSRQRRGVPAPGQARGRRRHANLGRARPAYPPEGSPGRAGPSRRPARRTSREERAPAETGACAR